MAQGPRAIIDGPAVRFRYVNYKGEESIRTVFIYEGGIRYGASEWHKTPQYLLLAYDTEKHADREFAMKDIKEWT